MSKHEAQEVIIARSFFELAISIDPNHAAAHSWLAFTYCMAGSLFGTMPLHEAVLKAEPHARHAISLDGEIADVRARLALVLYLKGDPRGAASEAEHALQIDPYCPEAHGLKGVSLVALGRPKEGRKFLRQCIQLSPSGVTVPMRHSQIAESYYVERNYEQAAQTAQQVIRQFPRNPQAHRWLAAALGQTGRIAEARAAWQTLVDTNPASLIIMARERFPPRQPAEHEHMLEGLRKAGWVG